MTTLRRAVTVVMVTAGLVGFGGAAVANAQDADEQFVKAVGTIGITAGPGTDLPALGRNVCNSFAQEFAKSPNPPPIVRGIIASLQNSNLSREQAVGFTQASMAIYCPQFARFLPR